MKFCFGDIVVVEDNLIGVIVKSWVHNNEEIIYEVYVRCYNNIMKYKENEIERYMVRHKELDDNELAYQKECLHPFIDEEAINTFLNKIKED